MPTNKQANTPGPGTDSSGYQDEIIKGHKYDGIQEYDNPMPGWWVWLFWGTIIFAVVYVLGIHVFGFVDTYDEDLADGIAELNVIREAYAAENPTFTVDAATLQEFVGDPDKIAEGGEHFAAQCASCHGAQGQGGIGPNLTDQYWLHGGTNLDIFNTISNGVLDKGMPPWEGAFSPEERAELVAFVRSLQGTNPPNAKEPQGELVE